MSLNEKINLIDLAAAAVAATVAASEPIRSYSSMNGEIGEEQNARLKLDGSVVTDADYAAQMRIMKALRRVEGNYIIVGEEEASCSTSVVEEEGKDDESIFRLARVEVANRFYGREGCPLQEGDTPESINTLKEVDSEDTDNPAEHMVDASRVRVYVDPLDGTKSYANGDYDAVTILIAIILDNTPYFGVIAKPFGYKGHASLLNTSCVVLYGGDLLRGVYFAGVREALSIPQSATKVPRAVISSSRSEGIVQDFVDHLATEEIVHPEPLKVSGAGEKSLRLIVGDQDESLWFFPKPGTSRWDVAASDALLRPLGGRLTNKLGEELDYSKSREEAENTEGLIATNSVALHEECIRLYREGNWDQRI